MYFFQNRLRMRLKYTLIDSGTFQRSLRGSNCCSTEVIVGHALYENIEFLNSNAVNYLHKYYAINEKSSRDYINSLIKKGFFINLSSNSYKRKLLSLFPTWQYCFAKKGFSNQDNSITTLYFLVPHTNTQVQINVFLTNNQTNKFVEEGYYFIEYQPNMIQVQDYLSELQLIILNISNPLNIIFIQELDFSINETGEPFLSKTNKDFDYGECL